MNSRGNENLNYFQNPYVKALAWAIMKCEGTTTYGYYTYFGGSRLSSLAKHPGKAITIGNYTSSASGAFQFLTSTWNGLAAKLGLSDFSENSQNAAFVELLRENNALDAILQGDFDSAIYQVRRIWASLPGAGYGQGEKSLSQVRGWFNDALNNSGLLPSNFNASTSAINTSGVLIGLLFLYLVLD